MRGSARHGRRGAYRVAATGSDRADDAPERLPAGEAHAWEPGSNATVCGLQLSQSRLERFPHVAFTDALPDTGGSADFVASVCPRCRSAVLGRGSDRSWVRRSPRP